MSLARRASLNIAFKALGEVSRLAWAALVTGAACAINVAGNLLFIPVPGLSTERRGS